MRLLFEWGFDVRDFLRPSSPLSGMGWGHKFFEGLLSEEGEFYGKIADPMSQRATSKLRQYGWSFLN